MTGRDGACQHRLRALVQAPQQQAGGGDDDEGHQHRAGSRALDRGVEGELGRLVEASCLSILSRVALHHWNCVQHLGRDRAGVGHAVLAGARELAHAFAEPHARQHHQHDDQQHLQHHIGIGPHQHDQCADAHDRIAQAHGERGADNRLHQRGVGGQTREHFAGLCGLEELRALPQHVAVDRVAQIGGDAFTEPADQVEAHRREKAERHRHAEQGREVAAQRERLLAAPSRRQTAVDEKAQGQRKRQRGRSGEHQKQDRQTDLQAVGPQKRQQAAE